MDYLRWAKVHPKVRYELTGSGIPSAAPEDFDRPLSPVSFEVKGAYGDPQLIDAIARRYGVPGDAIVPVAGASTGIFVSLAAAAEHDTTVMVEQPVYEPIRQVAEFRRLRVIPLNRRPDLGFDILQNDIEAGLDRGARAVFLTNLHNPSGRLLSPGRIEGIAVRCARSGATLIIDEVYLDSAGLSRLTPCWTATALADNVITLNSLTKVYGLGGLRVGWILARGDLAERARALLDLLHVDNPAPSASFAVDALTQVDCLERRFRRFYGEGQAVYRRWLAEEPLAQGYESYGAVFECLRLPDAITSDRLNDHLVTRYDTQVVPGSFFGLDNHVRLSIAVPPSDLAEALARISRALRDLQPG